MNVVRVLGGLGNQISQYAFGCVLLNSGRQVGFDLSWYTHKAANDKRYPRPFCLDKFQIPLFHIHGMDMINPVISEARVRFNPTVLQMKNENNFDGYWQYYSYYVEILPILRAHIQVQTKYYTDPFLKYAEQILDSNSISVHVRRGDYCEDRKGRFKDLPAAYYLNAIAETEGDLFIFSDDLPWCKVVFKQEYYRRRKLTFVEIKENYLAFELMKFCKKNVITNSSFSLWAALLNDNLDQTVWCPKHYLGDTVEYSNTYRYPKHWIKLEDYIE